jgi:hypothetical protein
MDTLATYDALDEGIAALQIRAEQTDTASPEGSRVRAAITTLEMIRDQQGCEHLGKVTGGRVEKDGRLVHLIDVVVFG